MKLLLIEGEKETSAFIKDNLEGIYIVESVSLGEEGEYLVAINDYDLIILDLFLPDMSGLDVCRRIRKNKITTPILGLTDRNDCENKVELLDAGCDGYLIKPFEAIELLAKIRAHLRRSAFLAYSDTLHIGDLVIDLQKRTVKRGERELYLRRKEFYLLEYMARNAGRVITREMILGNVWESCEDPITNIVDVHIKYLRDQIDKPFEPKLIKTVHGLGYKLELPQIPSDNTK